MRLNLIQERILIAHFIDLRTEKIYHKPDLFGWAITGYHHVKSAS
jgi:hypothetical protein